MSQMETAPGDRLLPAENFGPSVKHVPPAPIRPPGDLPGSPMAPSTDPDSVLMLKIGGRALAAYAHDRGDLIKHVANARFPVGIAMPGTKTPVDLRHGVRVVHSWAEVEAQSMRDAPRNSFVLVRLAIIAAGMAALHHGHDGLGILRLVPGAPPSYRQLTGSDTADLPTPTEMIVINACGYVVPA